MRRTSSIERVIAADLRAGELAATVFPFHAPGHEQRLRRRAGLSMLGAGFLARAIDRAEAEEDQSELARMAERIPRAGGWAVVTTERLLFFAGRGRHGVGPLTAAYDRGDVIEVEARLQTVTVGVRLRFADRSVAFLDTGLRGLKLPRILGVPERAAP